MSERRKGLKENTFPMTHTRLDEKAVPEDLWNVIKPRRTQVLDDEREEKERRGFKTGVGGVTGIPPDPSSGFDSTRSDFDTYRGERNPTRTGRGQFSRYLDEDEEEPKTKQKPKKRPPRFSAHKREAEVDEQGLTEIDKMCKHWRELDDPHWGSVEYCEALGRPVGCTAQKEECEAPGKYEPCLQDYNRRMEDFIYDRERESSLKKADQGLPEPPPSRYEDKEMLSVMCPPLPEETLPGGPLQALICPQCGASLPEPEGGPMSKCDYCQTIVRVAYISHDDGKYTVHSESGKDMGSYDSEKGAKKRLQQIEYFKHKGYLEQVVADTVMNVENLNLLGEKSELALTDTDQTRKFKVKNKGEGDPKEESEQAQQFFQPEVDTPLGDLYGSGFDETGSKKTAVGWDEAAPEDLLRIQQETQMMDEIEKPVDLFDRVQELATGIKGWAVEINDSKPGDQDIGVFWDEPLHGNQWTEVHPNEVVVLDEKIPDDLKAQLEEEIARHSEEKHEYDEEFKEEVREGKPDEDTNPDDAQST